MSRFFEDVAVGQVFELGSHTFTRDEIIRFARKYDPQPFHLSEKAGRATHFGGLCASGWHTAAIWMRLMVAEIEREAGRRKAEGKPVAPAGPSPGFRKLRWARPVFPGDTLTYRTTITAKSEWPRRPEWGLVESINTGTNQAGDLTFSFDGSVLFRRREVSEVAVPTANGALRQDGSPIAK